MPHFRKNVRISHKDIKMSYQSEEKGFKAVFLLCRLMDLRKAIHKSIL